MPSLFNPSVLFGSLLQHPKKKIFFNEYCPTPRQDHPHGGSAILTSHQFHLPCKENPWDFPDSPLVKNPPCNAGDTGLISGEGTKIPCVSEQLRLNATTRESVYCNKRSHMLQLRPGAAKLIHLKKQLDVSNSILLKLLLFSH